jgi:hypothetical protein
LPDACNAHQKFPFTRLVCVCIFFHTALLMKGGACSCVRVPLGFVIRKAFDLQRKPPPGIFRELTIIDWRRTWALRWCAIGHRP